MGRPFLCLVSLLSLCALIGDSSGSGRAACHAARTGATDSKSNNLMPPWFRRLFWQQEIGITIVGLEGTGKTTFANTVAAGNEFDGEAKPTIGFNMRQLERGKTIVKIWDISGKSRFRTMWPRYCRSADAIVFMVDASDVSKLDEAKRELNKLTQNHDLAGIPMLVIGNKRDAPNALDEKELIVRLNLGAITDREIDCHSISFKDKSQVDVAVDWLLKKAEDANPANSKMGRQKTCNLAKLNDHLPEHVLPTRYDLSLYPNLETMDYEGQVDISIDINEPRDKETAMNVIHLHVDDSVEIKSVKFEDFDDGNNEELDVSDASKEELLNRNRILETCKDSARQLIAIKFLEKLRPKSSGKLKIKFAAKIRDDLRGLYRSEYLDGEGRQQQLVVGQLLAADVRFMFPCFDDPKFRTVMSLQLMLEPEVEAMASTEIQATASRMVKNSEGIKVSRKVLKFKDSEQMPLGSFAFVIGKLESMSEQTATGVQVRVNAVGGNKLDKLKFALDATVKSIEWMEIYTGLKWPAERFDLVVLPDQLRGFSASWTLATVRDSVVMIDEQTRETAKATAAVNVANLVAHQYFGNLISPSKWTGLWLTEGLAAHSALEMVRELYPDYPLDYLLRLSLLTQSLELDSSGGQHPLSPQSVESSSEISELYDNFEFMKAASVMKMLQNRLGKQDFQLGIRSFVEKNQFTTVIGRRFLIELAFASGQSISELETLTQSWVKLDSCPLINVDVQDRKVIITQESLSTANPLIDAFKRGSLPKALWAVPLIVEFSNARSKRTKVEVELKPSEEPTIIEAPGWFRETLVDPEMWLKVSPHPDYATFFRVRYSLDLLDRMRSGMELKQMTPMDRVNLIDDATHLVKAGKINSESFQKIVAWHSDEQEPAVLIALAAAQQLRALQQESYVYSGRQSNVFEENFKRFGFSSTGGESMMEQGARQMLLWASVEADKPEVVEAALSKFDETNGGASLPVFLQAPVYLAVVKSKSKAKMEILLDRLERSQSHDEQMRLASLLAFSSDSDLLTRLFNWISESSNFRSDEALIIVSRMMRTEPGKRVIIGQPMQVAAWDKAPKQSVLSLG